MVRQAAKPKPDMSYSDYIASGTRLARLEADDMPNYAAMSYAELREEMKSRGMFKGGKKQRMISVLEDQFRYMRTEHRKNPFRQAEIDLRERPEMMLTSDFKSDPSRISFMDLPGEIRNMIYDLALFEPAESDFEQAGDWQINAVGDTFFLPRSEAYWSELDLTTLRGDRTLSVLHVLGALDKQIRKEVQTFFWAHVHVTITVKYSGQAYYYVVRRFLEKIGPLGRTALAGLTVHRRRKDYSQAQHQDFQALMVLLRDCKTLRTLDLSLPIHMVMGPPRSEGDGRVLLTRTALGQSQHRRPCRCTTFDSATSLRQIIHSE
ncbi:uncharacterized protein J4E87_000062 [Alternaria ethzedia]|uniref:uncharacterized protein n=1 Tax=Alternaria ethzedia TaxID=181014 RepID=UPI0020C28910|nr:uncharacterized protein J4E87_000062 [Alternaria ethzedia]KAI4635113.1 hypothetical protein J4E87_000062 [Alternaria ethzedia]